MDVLLAAAEDPADLLAFGSGGLSIRDQNRLGQALRTIEDDTSTYYVLGYAAPDGRQESQFRPLRVRVRRPDVTVRARHGYMAPARVTMMRAATPAIVEPKASESDPPKVASAVTEPPVAAPSISSTGTIVAAPLAARTGTVRVRPDAAERMREIAGSDPASADWLAHRGWDAYQRGDVESALGAFSEAAAQHDVRPWVVYALGLSQAALGRHADAAASWERVRRAAPQFESVYMDLADAYIQLADITKALAVLRDAEKHWPSDPDVHNAVGVMHVRRGALDDAIAAFSKAAAAAPDAALAYFNLGRAYEMRFTRGVRYVSSQRRWAGSDDDRRKAAEHYTRYVELGGPYANEASEALGRLEWSKK